MKKILKETHRAREDYFDPAFECLINYDKVLHWKNSGSKASITTTLPMKHFAQNKYALSTDAGPAAMRQMLPSTVYPDGIEIEKP